MAAGMRASLALALGFSLGPLAVPAQPQPQKPPAPSILSDEGKELWNDLDEETDVFSDNACEMREKLLKDTVGKSDQAAQQVRIQLLMHLGVCEFKKGDYSKAKTRMASCISEISLPSMDAILSNPNTAHIGFFQQAAELMYKQEVTAAATQLRRTREVQSRNLKKILKSVQKQLKQQGQDVPEKALLDDLPGYGKTGTVLPQLLPAVPGLKMELGFGEQVDKAVADLDYRVAAADPTQKSNRLRLASKSKDGSLLYVQGLPTDPTASGSQLIAANELKDFGAADAFVKEAAGVEKGFSLMKNSKESSGCKKGKGFEKTCAAVKKVADVHSNSFGETRVLVVKAGKTQPLDTCNTNANVGVLIAAKDGVSVTVGKEASTELAAGEPAVVDFCQEVKLDASATTPVLFAQAWHPEFAAVERTTEIRSRAKSFGLDDDAVKETTKMVNDFAKKSWEKGAKLWRGESAIVSKIRDALKAEVSGAKAKAEAEEEAKRREDEANDEERQKKLQELQRKREEKRKKEEAEEEKRRQRKIQLEEEKAKRDPWLLDPKVKEAEEKLADLKEQRRDANAKLEFDLSTSLTKEISTQERVLKKTIKAAKKAWKKSQKAGGKASGKEDKPEAGDDAEEKAEESGSASEVAKLKEELAKVNSDKKAAADSENFKKAKELKAKAKELEAQIKKLEL